jgi:hypothetical protein
MYNIQHYNEDSIWFTSKFSFDKRVGVGQLPTDIRTTKKYRYMQNKRKL